MTHLFEVTKVRSVCAYDYKFYRCDLILWREWQKLSSRKGPPCLCSNFGYNALHIVKYFLHAHPHFLRRHTFSQQNICRMCCWTHMQDHVYILFWSIGRSTIFVLLLYYHWWFTKHRWELIHTCFELVSWVELMLLCVWC